jgi:predicted aspartyl protease
MVTHKFKFTQIDTSRPMLAIRITNPQNGAAIRTYALIDTGADMCALPKNFAKILKCKLERPKHRRKKIRTGAGGVEAYFSVCDIEILGPVANTPGNAKISQERNGSAVTFSFHNISVTFLRKLETPLLGVLGFLDNMILKIEYPQKIFSMTEL